MPDSLFLILLCLLLALLAWIDLREGIIPDWLNLAIALLGLSDALASGWREGLLALGEGAAAGASLWLLRRLYFEWRNIQGLGLGDVKFVAAAGVSTGIAGIPWLLMIATGTALVSLGALRLAGRPMTRDMAVPFGPFLALGLLATATLQRQGWCC